MSRAALAALGISVLLFESEVEVAFWLERCGERAIALPWWLNDTPRGNELLALAYYGMVLQGQAIAS